MKKRYLLIFVILCSLGLSSCLYKKGIAYRGEPVSPGDNIGIIIDADNNVKNVVLAKFLQKGYAVKAVNASDLYTLGDVFTVEDYKYLAYLQSENSLFEFLFGDDEPSLLTTQRAFDNIYKLHVYNLESLKADMLKEIQRKWQVNYLIVLELKDWEDVCWGRAINLTSNQIVWIENYPTHFSDDIDSVVDHFIGSMSGQ